MQRYSTFFQLVRKKMRRWEPLHSNVQGEKTHMFQHCTFRPAQYTVSFIQGFTLSSTTRKIIWQQGKRTGRGLQAMTHIRPLQYAEIKTIHMYFADSKVSLRSSFVLGPKMSV